MRLALTFNERRTSQPSPAEAEFDTAATIAMLVDHLAHLGHEVVPIEVSGPIARLCDRLARSRCDLVFNIAEGTHGRCREAFYPALFEQLGLAHTHSNATTLAVCLDKALTKRLVAAAGGRVAAGMFVRTDDTELFADHRGDFRAEAIHLAGRSNQGAGNTFVRGPDTFVRDSDTFVRDPDTFVRGPDTFVRGPDTFVRGPDTCVCGSDTFVRGQDTFVRGPDMWIVKPNFEGASKGITEASIARSRTELDAIVRRQLRDYPDGVLVEEFVDGLDVSVAWLDGVGLLPAIGYRLVSSTDDRASDDRASDDRATDDRASDDRATDDRATDDGSINDRASDDRAIDDRATDDRASDDRATDDRATDDRAIDDRATDDRAIDDRAIDDRSAGPTTDDRTTAGSATRTANRAVDGRAAHDERIAATCWHPPTEVYDFERKHVDLSRVRVEIPAALDELVAKRLAVEAHRVFAALGISGIGRADFRITPAGDIVFLEMNPLPALGDGELFAAAARLGLAPHEVLASVIAAAEVRATSAVDADRERAFAVW